MDTHAIEPAAASRACPPAKIVNTHFCRVQYSHLFHAKLLYSTVVQYSHLFNEVI